MGINLLYGGRERATQRCLHSPATMGRYFQGVRGLILHTLGIPTQAVVPQVLGAPAQLSLFTETHPQEFLGHIYLNRESQDSLLIDVCPGDLQGHVSVDGTHYPFSHMTHLGTSDSLYLVISVYT